MVVLRIFAVCLSSSLCVATISIVLLVIRSSISLPKCSLSSLFYAISVRPCVYINKCYVCFVAAVVVVVIRILRFCLCAFCIVCYSTAHFPLGRDSSNQRKEITANKPLELVLTNQCFVSLYHWSLDCTLVKSNDISFYLHFVRKGNLYAHV